jgi:hypothetical protein
LHQIAEFGDGHAHHHCRRDKFCRVLRHIVNNFAVHLLRKTNCHRYAVTYDVSVLQVDSESPRERETHLRHDFHECIDYRVDEFRIHCIYLLPRKKLRLNFYVAPIFTCRTAKFFTALASLTFKLILKAQEQLGRGG